MGGLIEASGWTQRMTAPVEMMLKDLEIQGGSETPPKFLD
jgi:hypothetical protein